MSEKSVAAEGRLTFGQLWDRLAYWVLIGIAAYAANSIQQLNEKVAVVIDHIAAQDKRIDRVEDRQDNCECSSLAQPGQGQNRHHAKLTD